MITTLRDRPRQYRLAVALVAAAVLALAFLLGQRASLQWLGLLAAGAGGLLLLARPVLGLFALVLAALVLPLEIGTGTEVRLNPVTLLIPAVAGVWLLDGLRRRRAGPAALPGATGPSSSSWPPACSPCWSAGPPGTPPCRCSGNFLLVQLAQWAIFAFSAVAFWLTANLVRDERGLWRLTAFFLLVGGGVAILRLVPGLGGLARPLHHHRLHPCALLGAAGRAGRRATAVQPPSLHRPGVSSWPVRCWPALLYAFVQQQEAASNWVGVVAVAGRAGLAALSPPALAAGSLAGDPDW